MWCCVFIHFVRRVICELRRNIAGTNTLACTSPLEGQADGSNTIRIYPLPHMPVIKDLVVDMTAIFEAHKSIRPWLELSAENQKLSKEVLQSKEDRAKLDGLYECILCACCSTSCPSYWWSNETHNQYLGPAVLLQAFRWIADSRDSKRVERLAELASDEFKYVFDITHTVPRGIHYALRDVRIAAHLIQW